MDVGSALQIDASAAFDGTNYLVVWSDDRGGVDHDIFGMRIDSTGVPLDSTAFPIAAISGHQTDPSVAFDGTNYLVVWENHAFANTAISYRRVSTDGVVLDDLSSFVSAAFSYRDPAIAFGAGVYFLVYTTDLQIGGRILTTTGTTSGGPIEISSPPLCPSDPWCCFDFPMTPDVAFNGTSFLVVGIQYQHDECFIDTIAYLFGRRVSPTGTVLDDWGDILLAAYPPTAYLPRVASNGDAWFVVYEDGPAAMRGILGAPVSATGRAGTAVTIMNTSDVQREPAIAWDGHRYAVAWTDYRSDSEGDIWTNWVTAAGTVLDATGVETAASSTPEAGPGLVGADGGRLLLTYERTDDPIGTTRVKGRFISSADPDGTACTSGATCTSSYCVDGVCCETRCGDGSDQDCQACSKGAGGSVDGVCAPVPDTTECDDRDPCTIGERCNSAVCGGGTSAITVVPAAVVFPDTTVGDVSEVEVMIENIGSDSLTLGGLTSGEPAVFRVQDDPSPIALVPDGSIGVTIGFAPTAAGPYQDTLSAAIEECASVEAPLEARGLDPPLPPDAGVVDGSAHDASANVDDGDGGCACALGTSRTPEPPHAILAIWLCAVICCARRPSR